MQAYIHSRMRRRTADFLQGRSSFLARGEWQMLITLSTKPSQTRKRREREKDSEWTHVQSPRMTGIVKLAVRAVAHHLQDLVIVVIVMIHLLQPSTLLILPILVCSWTLKILSTSTPHSLPLQLCPLLRSPVLRFQAPKFGSRLGLIYSR